MADRFVADENFPGAGVRLLRVKGIDVVYVAEDMPGADDLAVSDLAVRLNAILLTFDRDFGELTFRRRVPVVGVVLFRLPQQPPGALLAVLDAFFTTRSEVRGFFTVVTPGQVRQRPLLRVVIDDDPSM